MRPLSIAPLLAVGTMLLLWSSTPAIAQDGFRLHNPLVQLNVRGGANQHLGGGEFFGDLRSWLTLDRRDLLAPSLSAEMAVMLGRHFDVAVGVGQSAAEARTDYRDWEGSDGLPIEQVTTLRLIPALVTVRYHLVPRGRTIGSHAWIPTATTPYVGVGTGLTWYTLTQQGEFVDHEDLSIFPSYLQIDGAALTTSLVAGVDRWFTPLVGMNLEVRYSRASATGTGGFRDYPSIDLSAFQAGVGVSLRH